ncbi:hypothetical protein VTN02DRAFT_4759 [Thermoascus thermophilus]
MTGLHEQEHEHAKVDGGDPLAYVPDVLCYPEAGANFARLRRVRVRAKVRYAGRFDQHPVSMAASAKQNPDSYQIT